MVNYSTTNRRDLILRKSRVREVLPEHHLSDYPNLVLFLEKYYDFLETDASMAFAKSLNELIKYRDINESPSQYLDLLIREIGAGLLSSDFFLQPRFATRLLSIFHRVKGSAYSAEGFFKSFFGIDPEIIYPKRNIFTVGESKIGPEDLQIIQDGALHQIYSILIKSELPLSEWNSLYKAFVHPAGFYLGAEVTITSTALMAENDMPTVNLDSAATIFTFVGSTISATEGAMDITALALPESDGTITRLRVDVDRTLNDLKDVTIENLDDMYQAISDAAKVSSPTFDEDSDVAGRTIDFSNTFEKFDEVKYPSYDSA